MEGRNIPPPVAVPDASWNSKDVVGWCTYPGYWNVSSMDLPSTSAEIGARRFMKFTCDQKLSSLCAAISHRTVPDQKAARIAFRGLLTK